MFFSLQDLKIKRQIRFNSLGLAVTLLCFNPYAVTDPSAVLSVLSVLGMLVVKPKIDENIKPEKLNKFGCYIYDGLTITLSVMVTTFPAIWLFFSNTTFISYLANLLLIPLAQLTMIGTLGITLFGFLKYFGMALSFLTYVALKLCF